MLIVKLLRVKQNKVNEAKPEVPHEVNEAKPEVPRQVDLNRPGQSPSRKYYKVLACLCLATIFLTSCSNNNFTYTVNTFKAPEDAIPSITETAQPGGWPADSTESADQSSSAADQAEPAQPEQETGEGFAADLLEPEEAGNVSDDVTGSGEANPSSQNPAYKSRDWILKPAQLEDKFRQVEAELDLDHEEIGYAFLDLESEEYWGKNLDKPFLAASVIKLPAALITYEWAAAGKLDLALPITIEEEDLELGTGPISAAGPGLTYTVEELLQAAIVHSDNTAFLALDRMWKEHGWLVNNMDIRYGLNYGQQRELTPRECLGFLWEFYDNPHNIPGYATLENYMKNTSYPAMAAAYIPDPVARKYGKNGGYYHDVGIVYSDRPFAFAIFTKNLANPAEAIGQLNLAFYQYSQELGN